jgi:hypothetical protein
MPGRAALLTALILDRPLCTSCLVSKSGLSPAELDATLAIVRSALQLHSIRARCRSCGVHADVAFVDRPSM